jgi:hypothetical protein
LQRTSRLKAACCSGLQNLIADDEQSVTIDPSLVWLATKVVPMGLTHVVADVFRPICGDTGWMTSLKDVDFPIPP